MITIRSSICIVLLFLCYCCPLLSLEEHTHFHMASDGSAVQKKKKMLLGRSKSVTFPKTLDGFGYRFQNGRMKHITTGASFEFEERKGDHEYNQKRYEALGEAITEHVYNLLITEGRLRRKIIPINASEGKASTFIFHSEDAFVNSKLIILIHGSGVVRAGQWSRRLIINDCLDSGTQLPFIRKAHSLGYGVIVLNTNDNYRVISGRKEKIRGSQNAESHASYVWEHVVSSVAAKYIAVIAHSYGGVVSVNLCNTHPTACQKRIFSIAFTDSVHSLMAQGTPPSLVYWFKKVCRNWVSSTEPLDSPIARNVNDDIDCVSAGTDKHEMTSWSSFASIFEFVEQRYREASSADAQTGRGGDL